MPQPTDSRLSAFPRRAVLPRRCRPPPTLPASATVRGCRRRATDGERRVDDRLRSRGSRERSNDPAVDAGPEAEPPRQDEPRARRASVEYGMSVQEEGHPVPRRPRPRRPRPRATRDEPGMAFRRRRFRAGGALRLDGRRRAPPRGGWRRSRSRRRPRSRLARLRSALLRFVRDGGPRHGRRRRRAARRLYRHHRCSGRAAVPTRRGDVASGGDCCSEDEPGREREPAPTAAAPARRRGIVGGNTGIWRRRRPCRVSV